MWLSILIVVLIIGGIVAAIGGLGVFAFVPVFLGLIGLAILFVGRATGAPTAGAGGDDGPQDTEHAPREHSTPRRASPTAARST
jgi:hypothetical protein